MQSTAPAAGRRASGPAIPDDQSADHHLLGRLLAYSRGGTTAARLLERFPSLGHVLAAEPHQLDELGISGRDAALFRLVRDIATSLARGAVRARPKIANSQALSDYCQTAMAYGQVEHIRVLYLDRGLNLIADEAGPPGTVDHAPLYPREIAKRALLLNASAVIVVHNHPSGDPKPSRGDIDMTRELQAALGALGIELHEHLVIGHGRHASFRALGLLSS